MKTPPFCLVSKKHPAPPYPAYCSLARGFPEMLTAEHELPSCLQQSLPISDQIRRDPNRAQSVGKQKEHQGYTGLSFVNPLGSLHWEAKKATNTQLSPQVQK
uniref:Uncharacterized protein n=1 Tax=Amazona collaria TaxID=241587 RepID=A0A8B9IZZ4_9PSIT